MAYNSKGEAKCSSPGFYNYLNGLREEFEILSNTTLKKSLRPSRFNIYLGGLKGEFELMAVEITSLQKERDDYRKQGTYYRGSYEFLSLQLRCKRGNFAKFATRSNAAKGFAVLLICLS